MRVKSTLSYYLLSLKFCALAVAGVWYFDRGLNGYSWAFGPRVFVLFIPPCFCLGFLIIIALGQKLQAKDFMVAVGIFFISLVPLGRNLLQDIQYFEQDDGYRYSKCAHNMVD